jgi:hypothetical protein
MDCIRKREEDDKMKKALMAIRKAFEYGVYFYLMMAISMFAWINAMSEIAAVNVKNGFSAISFVFSVVVIIFLFAAMLFPVLMVILEYRAKKHDDETDEEDDEEEPKLFFGKIWAHYQYGVKKTIPAQLFYTAMQFKYFCYSIIFILIDGQLAQIALFIIVTFAYYNFYLIVRPFKFVTQNVVVIFNETIILIIAGLFCGFLEDGWPNQDLATTIIIIFAIDVVACFTLGIIFQIYLTVMKYKDNKTSVDPVPKPVKQNTPSVLETGRGLNEQKLRRRGDEDDFPEKNTHFHVPKETMNQHDLGMTTKHSNSKSNLFPDHQFLRNTPSKSTAQKSTAAKSTAAKSRFSDGKHVGVFGGNLRDF